MKRTWSDADIAYLREHYPHRPTAEIAAEMGRTEATISQAAFRYIVYKTPEYIAKASGFAPKKRIDFLGKCRELLSRPLGAGRSELVGASGIGAECARAFLSRAVRKGEIFSVGRLAQMRYFLTAELARTGAVLIEEEQIEQSKRVAAARVARQKARYEVIRAARPPRVKKVKPPKVAKVRAPKPPKPRKEPKPIVWAEKKTKKPALPRFNDLPAINPRGIQPTPIPTPRGRYEVSPELVGEFQKCGIGRYL